MPKTEIDRRLVEGIFYVEPENGFKNFLDFSDVPEYSIVDNMMSMMTQSRHIEMEDI
jgi:hypothetical protein